MASVMIETVTVITIRQVLIAAATITLNVDIGVTNSLKNPILCVYYSCTHKIVCTHLIGFFIT